MATSCGFSFSGTQEVILAALKAEEQRLVSEGGRAHRSDDLSRLAQQHFKKVDQIRKLLAEGEKYYNLGKYHDASSAFKKVVQIDRYNSGGRKWLERVDNAQSESINLSYNDQGVNYFNEYAPPELPNSIGGNLNDLTQFGALNYSQRSGDQAVTRNSIDFYLNNPNRQSNNGLAGHAIANLDNSFDVNTNRLNGNFDHYAWLGSTSYRSQFSNQVANDPFDGSSSRQIESVPQRQVGSSQLPSIYWSSQLFPTTNGQFEITVTMPDEVGAWDLTVLGADNSGPTRG